MKILKKKISAASGQDTSSASMQISKQKTRISSCPSCMKSRETKNLVKNYGRAIFMFSISSLALPYLNIFLETEKIELSNFVGFAKKSKIKVDRLGNFSEILLPKESDDDQTKHVAKYFNKSVKFS